MGVPLDYKGFRRCSGLFPGGFKGLRVRFLGLQGSISVPRVFHGVSRFPGQFRVFHGRSMGFQRILGAFQRGYKEFQETFRESQGRSQAASESFRNVQCCFRGF